MSDSKKFHEFRTVSCSASDSVFGSGTEYGLFFCEIPQITKDLIKTNIFNIRSIHWMSLLKAFVSVSDKQFAFLS